MTIHRSTGDNGISPNAIKALDKENRSFLFEICSDFFENKVDIKEWQIGVLKILQKGDLTNPNNWRRINLLDVVSKVISIVITNRLQLVLTKPEHPCSLVQHQKQGVQTVHFSIKTLLQMRKAIDESTWGRVRRFNRSFRFNKS